MDIGVISSRYAKALLRFATGNHDEDKVYRELDTLVGMFLRLPQLSTALQNPVLPTEEKLRLLSNACGGQLTPSAKLFFDLVIRKSRTSLIPFIAHAYLSIYERTKHIIKGNLTMARPLEDKQMEALKHLIEERSQGKVEFTIRTDSDLDGGFILEYDTYRLDASVRGQMQHLRRALKS